MAISLDQVQSRAQSRTRNKTRPGTRRTSPRATPPPEADPASVKPWQGPTHPNPTPPKAQKTEEIGTAQWEKRFVKLLRSVEAWTKTIQIYPHFQMDVPPIFVRKDPSVVSLEKTEAENIRGQKSEKAIGQGPSGGN